MPRALLALAAGVLLALLTLLPLPGGPAGLFAPVASAHPLHALPVRSDPPARAILQAPPSQVHMWFSEDLNPLTSHLWVVDPANRAVDRQDSHVSSSDARELEVGVPLLPAGTYVVVWRTQSAEDGHIVGGSYYFRIARPDGSVPPVPAVLPTGHIPGTGGTGVVGSSGLDGPTVLQAVATWLALLFLTFWVGGVIWETWILSPVGAADPDLAAAGQMAARRFRRLAPWALAGVLIADVAVAFALGAELVGDWSGLVAPHLLAAILFGSRFGLFWWMRQAVAGVALVMAVLECRGAGHLVSWRDNAAVPARPSGPDEPQTLAEWPTWSLAALRRMPGALAQGWRRRTAWGRLVLVLSGALLVAFALSGHAAAVPQNTLAYALAVDLLHLLGNAAWLGGILYIAVVLVPALRRLPDQQRAELLARGLPQFSALALATVAVLAVTGTLNGTIHLTSPAQLLTTAYGRTLVVKGELFLIMAAVSAYHAFRLRPRLARALAMTSIGSTSSRGTAVALASAERVEPAFSVRQRSGGEPDLPSMRSPSVREHSAEAATPGSLSMSASTSASSLGRVGAEAGRLMSALEDWLRREAVLGVGVLACVALLAAFAGSLTPAAAASSGSSGTTSSAFVSAPQTSGGLTVVLKVTPAAFGTNTFTVSLTDASGKPVDGASVLIATEMLDMDMGVQTAQLQPMGSSAPGAYSGQSDLTMAGHWAITVKVLPPSSKQFVTYQFRLAVTY